MPMPVESLRAHLEEAFPDAAIEIDDLAGDGDIIVPASSRRPFRACPA